MGGVYNDSEREKCRLFEYSLSANTWDMFDTHIANFALASYKSTLMLIGGIEYEFCRFSSTEKSPTNKIWFLNDQYQLQEADIPPMNVNRKSAQAIGHRKHLIVVGGDLEETKTVEVYDSDTEEWLFAPSLPQSSLHVRSPVIHLDGNLYIQLESLIGYKSRIIYASLESVIAQATSSVQGNDNSFWNEISHPWPFNTLSNVMLCQGHLILIGSDNSTIYRQDHPPRSIFVYQPSGSTPRWLDIASVPLDLYGQVGKAHIISASDEQFLLLGEDSRNARHPQEDMFFIPFQGHC